MKEWCFTTICFIFVLLGCCLSGCKPKQSTNPGDFGHLIYRQEARNLAEWSIIGMYLNDSLIVLGDPRCVGYKYPIYNKNNGKIVGYYEISKK